MSRRFGSAGAQAHALLLRRSFLLLRRYRALLAAVFTSFVLLSLVAASALLFASATGAAALRSAIDEVTLFSAGMTISRSTDFQPPRTRVPGGQQELSWREREALVRGAKLDRIPHLGAEVATILAESFDTIAGRPVRPVSRTGALREVEKLGQDSAVRGFWIADTIADQAGVEPGGFLTIMSDSGREVRIPVRGVYRALWKQAPTPYWRSLFASIYPPNPDSPPPPTFMIGTPGQVVSLSQRLGVESAVFRWEFPLETGDLSLEAARQLVRRFEEIERQINDPDTELGRGLRCESCLHYLGQSSSFTLLPAAVVRASDTVRSVRGPAQLLSVAGLAVALAVVAAAGVFSVARRRVEATWLFAHGWSPTVFAVKAGIEALLAALVGGGAGVLLAYWVVTLTGGGNEPAEAAIRGAAIRAGMATLAGLLVFAAASAMSFARLFDLRRRRRLRFARSIPVELILLAVSGALLLRLRSGGGFVLDDSGEPVRLGLTMLLFPLFALAGGSVFLARLLSLLLRRRELVSRARGRLSFLAVRRLASAPRLVMLLVSACAATIGVFAFAQALVSSLEKTVDTKAKIFVGGDVRGLLNRGLELPEGFPFPATVTAAKTQAVEVPASGAQADLLAVDAKTFAQVAYWDTSWSEQSLEQLLAELDGGASSPLRVIVAGGSLGESGRLAIEGTPLPVEIVARTTAFPGMGAARPLVIASSRALDRQFAERGVSNPLNQVGVFNEVWVRGSADLVVDELNRLPAPPEPIVTVDEIREGPTIKAATRTFSFFKALGLGAAALAIVGLLLYIQARQRQRVISFALASRMGLSDRTHRGALALENGCLLGAALAIGFALAYPVGRIIASRADPLPHLPPKPLFAVSPKPALYSAGVLLLVALVSAAVSHLVVRRMSVAQVLRLGE